MNDRSTVPVTLHVPEALVLEFQARAIQLIQELVTGVAGRGAVASDDAWPVTASVARARPLWGGDCPKWGSAADDLERAVWVLKHLTGGAVKLVAAMAHSSGTQATGDALGLAAGYPNGARSVAPVLGAVGLRCRQVNREALWGWQAGASGNEPSTYELPAEAARLFQEALSRVRPDLRGSSK